MSIANITCDFLTFDIPLPVRDQTVEYGIALVTIETESGLRGAGLTRAYDFQARSVADVIANDIAPFIAEFKHPLVPGHVWHEAYFEMPRRSDYRSAVGAVSGAMSAVDQALWDIRGQELGEPIFRLLGGAQSVVDTYATFGLNIYTPEEEAEAARLTRDKGFTAFKLQGAGAGRGRDFAHDAGRVRRLRETLGDDAQIILDGHNSYDLYQAVALAKMIEPYNVAFLDEPSVARDHRSMRRLRQSCPGIPIAARSRNGNIWGNRDLIVGEAVDLVGSNVIDQGGFTQSIKIAHLAELYQLPMVTGGAWHLPNSHLIAAATSGWMTEYHSLAAWVIDTIFDDPVKPENGKLYLTEKPGLGCHLNDSAVADAKARSEVASSPHTSRYKR